MPPPALATLPNQSALCLVDSPISARPAPSAALDDVGNRFDTDETTDALLAHNAAYRAACPSSDQVTAPVESK
jgi:hypothetical protein